MPPGGHNSFRCEKLQSCTQKSKATAATVRYKVTRLPRKHFHVAKKNRLLCKHNVTYLDPKDVFGWLDLHGWDGTIHGLVVFGLLDHWDEKIPDQGIDHKMLDFLVHKNLTNQFIHFF